MLILILRCKTSVFNYELLDLRLLLTCLLNNDFFSKLVQYTFLYFYIIKVFFKMTNKRYSYAIKCQNVLVNSECTQFVYWIKIFFSSTITSVYIKSVFILYQYISSQNNLIYKMVSVCSFIIYSSYYKTIII